MCDTAVSHGTESASRAGEGDQPGRLPPPSQSQAAPAGVGRTRGALLHVSGPRRDGMRVLQRLKVRWCSRGLRPVSGKSRVTLANLW